jgi:tetratricopeptide (TPR) repeat protein
MPQSCTKLHKAAATGVSCHVKGESLYFCSMSQRLVSVMFFTAVLAAACGSNTTEKEKKNTGTPAGLPEAIVQLQQQVSRYPDSTGLRWQLAMNLDSLGHYQEAIAQMDSLLHKDSTNYGLWFSRAQLLEDARDTARAMESYAKAISIYPSPESMLGLANLYAEKKDRKALALCSQVQALRLGREFDAHCAFIAGVYYARTGNTQQALTAFDACIASQYTYMEAYIEKGLLFFDQKKYAEALAVFSFASRVNNLYPDAYYYQARAYEMMGKKDSAVLRYQQSLSLDKNLTEAHAGLHRLGAE